MEANGGAGGIDPEDIERTERVIRPYVRLTPIVEVSGADLGVPGATMTLKLEQLQRAGSFKTRGAFANLLLRTIGTAGVAAASGGNHGTAVAYAAGVLGVPAKVFVPTVSAPAKVERIRSYGADLVVGGDLYADALAGCENGSPPAARRRSTRSTSARRCSGRAASGWSWRTSCRRWTPCWSRSAAAG